MDARPARRSRPSRRRHPVMTPGTLTIDDRRSFPDRRPVEAAASTPCRSGRSRCSPGHFAAATLPTGRPHQCAGSRPRPSRRPAHRGSPSIAAAPAVVRPAPTPTRWHRVEIGADLVPDRLRTPACRRRRGVPHARRRNPSLERRHNPGLPDDARRVDRRHLLRDTGDHATSRPACGSDRWRSAAGPPRRRRPADGAAPSVPVRTRRCGSTGDG